MARRINPRRVRMQLKVKQGPFWRRIGVTQSGGSRYEAGRPMPAPTRMLFELAYDDDAKAAKAFTLLRSGV